MSELGGGRMVDGIAVCCALPSVVVVVDSFNVSNQLCETVADIPPRIRTRRFLLPNVLHIRLRRSPNASINSREYVNSGEDDWGVQGDG